MKPLYTLQLTALLLTALLLPACKKDGLITYEKSPDIFFTRAAVTNNSFRVTTSTVKFENLAGDTYLDTISLSFMGVLADYDRPVKVVVCPDSTTAKEGIHYRILKAEVPADTNRGYVIVEALRAQNQQDRAEVRLRLKLEPNEHFGTDFNVLLNNLTAREKQSTLEFDIYISNEITMPFVWSFDLTVAEWGRFSFAKYNIILMSEVVGMPPCYWDGACPFEGRNLFPHADVPVVGMRLRIYLQERFLGIIPGGPVVDDDGVLIDDVPGFWIFPE
jgi:hypothetical protein